MKHYEVRTYRPILDYGGWGIRYNLQDKSYAYNVSGNQGLWVEDDKGKCVMIGSQKPEKLQRALDELRR